MLQPQDLTTKALSYPGLNLKSLESTVLATIINKKVEDVENIDTTGVRTAPHYSLSKALEKDGKRHFILECKQSSPTLGDFCKDFDLDKLIDCYQKRASAISVLCEEHFFKGSLTYLKYVKDKCSLPVICKDFIICKDQIKAAYVAGADAVLLMLSVLTKDKYLELYEYAHSLNLDVLTEVDDKEQALFTVEHDIEIVGINNRNLRTLTIDLDNARSLRPLFKESTKLVSESGIKTFKDLVSLNPIKNFLIGSSLTIENDVNFKANSMLYGLNKLCGLTTRDAVVAAIDNHVAIGGLIFAKKSPRFVTKEFAKSIVDEFKGQIRFAGVFVNEDVDTMVDIAKSISLDYIQLHGSESIDTIKEIKAKLPSIKIIKAINIKSKDDYKTYSEYLPYADLMLLDSSNPGSGSSFDWNNIDAIVDKDKTLLSGGIGLDNVNEALSQGFAGLDVNSKLEKQKGVKDVDLINQFFTKVKEF